MRYEDSIMTLNDTVKTTNRPQSLSFPGALRAYMRIGATARYARHRVLTCTPKGWASTCSRALVAPRRGACFAHARIRALVHARENHTAPAWTRAGMRLNAPMCTHSRIHLGRRRNAWMRRCICGCRYVHVFITFMADVTKVTLTPPPPSSPSCHCHHCRYCRHRHHPES